MVQINIQVVQKKIHIKCTLSLYLRSALTFYLIDIEMVVASYFDYEYGHVTVSHQLYKVKIL